MESRTAMNQAIERLARILDVDIEPGSSSWMIRLSNRRAPFHFPTGNLDLELSPRSL